MLSKMVQNKKGFTLIELMIVVAIIGILAAIAIPNFIRYQLKAKTAEAKTNLKAIGTSQEAYRAEMDGYVSVAATPANGTPSKVVWTIVPPLNPARGGGAGSFEDIGFRPSGDVYYTYASAVGADGNGNANQCFTADATADLDGDATLGSFAISQFDAVANLVGNPQGVGTTSNIINTMSVTDLNPGQF